MPSSMLKKSRRFVPLVRTRVAVLVAGLLGALAWPVLWSLILGTSAPESAARKSATPLAFAVMVALTPVNLAVHAWSHAYLGGVFSALTLTGCALNGLFWGMLVGAANWGRLNLRWLMWVTLTTVAAYWLIIAVVTVGILAQAP